jgi:hypothetical protein
MDADMLVIGPEVVADRPWLDDGIEVERRERVRRPARPAKGDVGVERRDLRRRRRQMSDRDIEQVLLAPRHGGGAQWNMRKARPRARRQPLGGEVREFIAAATIGAFGERHMEVRLSEPRDERIARQCSAALPAQRVGHAGDDVESFQDRTYEEIRE